MSEDNYTDSLQVKYSSRNLWSGILFGIGLAAFLDEVIFHQLLNWHYFYDGSTTQIGLLSDGFFHAFSWFATVGSLFIVADLRSRAGWWAKRWIGGALIGLGGFNLYDGIVQHKIMRIHQVRNDTGNLLMYDIGWNMVAAIILIAGIIVVVQTGKKMKGNRS
ncbi:putative membrane protein [Virgibacillus natechei]|uniref:Membrane protein n=1 Tax=Virgibacillus natechei TaxID=1216297 RepID=A0ABS4IKF6_9BACI|nr:putative membrane protein [Virgibacillus natechei]